MADSGRVDHQLDALRSKNRPGQPMIAVLIAAIICSCSIGGPADGPYQPADRLYDFVQENPPPPPPQLGILGLPFAPEGLSDCEEMTFYRVQFGLPDKFDRLGWRESNCRNENGVHTSCCWGYWQLHQMHLSQPRYDICQVDSYADVNSDSPREKQKQACAAKQLYDVQPGAWNQ